MLLRWTLATLHLLALGIGLGAVWARARALAAPLDRDTLRRAFTADAWWGVAGLLWLATGLWRFLGGVEKGTDYYLANHAFLGKMGAFVLIVLLEVWAGTTLGRWRRVVGPLATRGAGVPDAWAPTARRLAGVSYLEAALVVVMVGLATAMARGLGLAR